MDLSGVAGPAPVVEKPVAPGSYIVTADIGITAAGAAAEEFASASCVLADSESGGTAKGIWTGATTATSPTPSAAGEITLTLAMSSLESSKLTVECEQVTRATGEVEITANNGSLVAVQTTENS